MKTYIVYVDGNERGTLKAAGHNAAEKKAQKKYGPELKASEAEVQRRVSVAYTEV